MNTFAKLTSGAALALALALPTASPALAGDDDPIVVQSKWAKEQSMAQWQEATTRDLDRALSYNPTSGRLRPNNGIVQLTFTLGEDGRAQDIELYDGPGPSTGNGMARRIAKRAVRQLRTLNEVPVAKPQNVRFLASLIFADNEDIHERLKAKLKASERTRMASASGASEFIGIGS